jgi:hypothetical protein
MDVGCRPPRRFVMHIDKQFVLDELRKQGKNEHVQKAIEELPDKIDHNEHAAMLEKFGLDPGKLAQRAAEHAVGAPEQSEAKPAAG